MTAIKIIPLMAREKTTFVLDCSFFIFSFFWVMSLNTQLNLNSAVLSSSLSTMSPSAYHKNEIMASFFVQLTVNSEAQNAKKMA